MDLCLFEPEFSGDDSSENDNPNIWEKDGYDDADAISSGSDNFEEDFVAQYDPNFEYKLSVQETNPW